MEDLKIYTSCGHYDKDHFRADKKDCNIGDRECLACGFLSRIINKKNNLDVTELYRHDIKHGISTK